MKRGSWEEGKKRMCPEQWLQAGTPHPLSLFIPTSAEVK